MTSPVFTCLEYIMNTLIAENLAQEYEHLLELPLLSEIEAKRIAEILKLAESNQHLNYLIQRSDQNLIDKYLPCHTDEYYKNEQQKLEECLKLIDNQIDLKRFH